MSYTHKFMWLNGGQFHCDEHRSGVPFVVAPMDAECAECSKGSPKSYLAANYHPTTPEQ